MALTHLRIVNNPEVSSTKPEHDESKTTESKVKGDHTKPRNLFYPGIDYSGLASSLIPGLTAGYAPGFIPGFAPGLAPGFVPGFPPGFAPGFAPGLGYGYGYGNGYPIGGIEYIDQFFP
uniref:Uncharacterized protein n=1 Tax=Tetranychus urticae TaxID=32264 RepID=T1KQM1_TETUR